MLQSQTLIRGLKASDNPEGLPKIVWARQMWDVETPFLPDFSKEEIIVEWILNSMTMSKSKNISIDDPVGDIRYWNLLKDIVCAHAHANLSLWLSTSIRRTSVTSTVTSFFRYFTIHKIIPNRNLLQDFTVIFKKMWPTIGEKSSSDSLLECIGSILSLVATSSYLDRLFVDDGFNTLLMKIISSFCNALERTHNKKKLFAIICEKHLRNWIVCMVLAMQQDRYGLKALQTKINRAFMNVFFSTDVLRGSSGPHIIFDALDGAILLLEDRKMLSYVLPIFYQEYIFLLHKEGTAIFAYDSRSLQSQIIREKIRDAVLEGFVSCYRVLQSINNEYDTLRGIASLLEILQKDSATYSEGIHYFKNLDICAWVLNMLATGRPSSHAECSLRILNVLGQINWEILTSSLPTILSHLTNLSISARREANKFLQLLFDFYTKKCEIDLFIEIVISCFSDLTLTSTRKPFDITKNTHDDLSEYFPVFALCQSEEFCTAIRLFLLPSQCVDVIKSLLKAVIRSWTTLNLERLKFSSVITSFDMQENGGTENIGITSEGKELLNFRLSAIQFSLLSGISELVMSSLSLEQLSQSSFSSPIRHCIGQSWCSFLFSASQNTFTSLVSTSTLTSVENPSIQLIAVGLLRLSRFLLSPAAVITGSNADVSGFCPSSGVIVNVLHDDYVHADLVIELLENLIWYIEGDMVSVNDIGAVLDAVLLYVNRCFESDNEYLRDRLDPGGRSSYNRVSVFLYLLSTGWLYVIDDFATLEQLNTLSEIYLKLVGCSTQFEDLPTFRTSMLSAEIWDLSNVRTSLLHVLLKRVAFLDNLTFDNISASREIGVGATLLTLEQIDIIGNAFRFLLECPIHYISRIVIKDFVTRAIVADVNSYLFIHASSDNEASHLHKLRITLRLWIGRAIKSFDCSELLFQADSSKYFMYLINNDLIHSTLSVVSLFTLQLMAFGYEYVVEKAQQGVDSYLLELINKCHYDLIGISTKLSSAVVLHSLFLLIDAILSRRNAPFELYSLSCQGSLRQLHFQFTSILTSSNANLLPMPTSMNPLLTDHHLLKSRKMALLLSKWMKYDDSITDKLNLSRTAILQLLHAQTTINTTTRDQLYLELISLLSEQFQSKLHIDFVSDAETFIVAYLFIRSNTTRKAELDDALLGFTQGLTTDAFPQFLLLIRNYFATGRRFNDILHLSFLTLLGSPIVRALQTHLEQCLIAAMNKDFLNRSAAACVDVLYIIAKYCYQRPALIRSSDVGMILLFLTELLSSSKQHDVHTSAEIFHAILVVTTVLLRLRHDLILESLPSLSLLVAQLLISLSERRRNLGNKQSLMFDSSSPWWINSQEPLDETEARALSRFLTMLSTRKSDTKLIHGSGSHIAKSFSKHAPHILTAYASIMTDPFHFLPFAVRKELQSGLFCMCDVIAEHVRNAMMVSDLDSNGKYVIRELWKSYSKQKYMGKG